MPAAVQPASAATDIVIQGLASPESVAVLGDRRFISNLGARVDPTGKDGDGFISEADAAGKLMSLHALPKPGDPPLDAPKGMAVVDGILYVADIDRVVGYDTATGRQAFEATVGGHAPGMLNDLAIEDDGHLLASDTLRSTLYRLDLAKKSFSVVAAGINGANGIAIDADARVAYVAALGSRFEGDGLYAVSLATTPATVQRLPGAQGVFDGIALAGDRLLASDWVAVDKPTPGRLRVFGLDGKAYPDLRMPRALHGPADILYDVQAAHLWIPLMPDNRVLLVPLPARAP